MSTVLTRLDTIPRGIVDSLMPVPISMRLTGNYVVGGDIMDFTTLNPALPNNNPVLFVDLPVPFGYANEVIPGLTQAGAKIKFYSSENVELLAAAYPAGLLNYTFNAIAWFRKF